MYIRAGACPPSHAVRSVTLSFKMDPNSLFYVAATLKIVPEKVDEVLAGFNELAGLVEANEPGCLSYQVFYSEADSEVAVFEM